MGRRRRDRGFIRERRPGRFTVGVTLGVQNGKLMQVTEQVRGTREDAQRGLTALLSKYDAGELAAPSEETVAAFAKRWLTIVDATRRQNTAKQYRSVVESTIIPELGHLSTQRVSPLDCTEFFIKRKQELRAVSAHGYFVVLKVMLSDAVKLHLLRKNPALGVAPKRSSKPEQIPRSMYWEPAEVERFLAYTRKTGDVQTDLLYRLALFTGARRNELLGLRWSNIDFVRGELNIEHQLATGPARHPDGNVTPPRFGPLKAGGTRHIKLAPEITRALQIHRAGQREFLMSCRSHYDNFDLIFARRHEEATTVGTLGWPLSPMRLSSKDFHRLTAAAGVRRIKFHGLRHTSATTLLARGVAVHVVAERLGHSNPKMTLDTYAHVLRSQEVESSAVMDAVIS